MFKTAFVLTFLDKVSATFSNDNNNNKMLFDDVETQLWW
jgi:hypothetical protein